MNDTLTLRNDYLFKRLLGAEENKACLQDFLECVLDIEAETITDPGIPHYKLLQIKFSETTAIRNKKQSF